MVVRASGVPEALGHVGSGAWQRRHIGCSARAGNMLTPNAKDEP